MQIYLDPCGPRTLKDAPFWVGYETDHKEVRDNPFKGPVAWDSLGNMLRRPSGARILDLFP
jgi:hypothetical protein